MAEPTKEELEMFNTPQVENIPADLPPQQQTDADVLARAQKAQKDRYVKVRKDYEELMRRKDMAIFKKPVPNDTVQAIFQKPVRNVTVEKLHDYLLGSAFGGFTQGFGQGATLHHNDEISAASDAGTWSGDDYQKALDFYRQEDRSAQNASPTAYGIGEFLGGFVPASGIGKLGGVLAKAGGAVASKVAPAVSAAASKYKNLANLLRLSGEGATMFGADTAGRQTDPDAASVALSSAVGAAVPFVTTPAMRAAAESPTVQNAIENATRYTGKAMQKPAQALDWAMETIGNRVQQLGPAMKRIIPEGILSVGPNDAPGFSPTAEKLKKSWTNNDLLGVQDAYRSALQEVQHLKPDTTSVAAAWSDPAKKDAIIRAVQATFRERALDAYDPPADAAAEIVERAITQGGGKQSLTSFLRGTVKEELISHFKGARNAIKLVGTERLMQDEQMARAVYEISDAIRRAELGMLDNNLINPKNMAISELEAGTRMGQLGGYGSTPTYFTLKKQWQTSMKPRIMPSAEEIAAAKAQAEREAARLTDIATGNKLAKSSILTSIVGGGAASGFLGGKVGLLLGGGPLLAGVATYAGASVGETIETNAAKAPAMLQAALRNTDVLQKLAKLPGKAGQAAQWAMQGMAEGGQQGLKSRVFILSQMPEIRAALLSNTSDNETELDQ